jgi:oligoendopeptidase F
MERVPFDYHTLFRMRHDRYNACMTSMRARATRPIAIGFAVAMLLTLTSVAQERDRAKIPDKYKWDLTEIYPTDAAWRTAKSKLQAEIPHLGQFKGKLSSSAAVLADALDTSNALDKELSRLYVYASMLADQDTRDGQHQGMRQ